MTILSGYTILYMLEKIRMPDQCQMNIRELCLLFFSLKLKVAFTMHSHIQTVAQVRKNNMLNSPEFDSQHPLSF